MALKVYYSDRIEDLAVHLKDRLIAERQRSDPFVFSQVVVPNTNIAKWLQIRVFADSPSLCMGVEFPFIEQRLFGLLSESEDGEHIVVAVIAFVVVLRPFAVAIQVVLLHVALSFGVGVPHFIDGVVFAFEGAFAEIERYQLRSDVRDEGVAHGEDCVTTLVAGEEQVVAQDTLLFVVG